MNTPTQTGGESATPRTDEISELRAIFPLILKALDNGSACVPDGSIDFLKCIPEEVSLTVARYRRETATLHAQIARMKQREGELVGLLQLAANSDVTGLPRDPVSNLPFRAAARTLLQSVAKEGEKP